MLQLDERAAGMTTEEAIRELFPRGVVERAKQVVAELDARDPVVNGEASIESDGNEA